MDARNLRSGMEVKFSNGNIVKVTHVPTLDKNGECFFDGVLVETNEDFYKEFIGKDLQGNWNSAFCFPV